jgi:hypothetical protein
MTTPSSSFVAAPAGWRVALAHPPSNDVTVLPVVCWQAVTGEEEPSVEDSPVEPVVLFDNVKGAIISTVSSTIEAWGGGSYIHQILAPGAELRDVPEGWKVHDPYTA